MNVTRIKEIIKIRTQINEIEHKKIEKNLIKLNASFLKRSIC